MLMEKSLSVAAYSSIGFVLWMTLGGGQFKSYDLGCFLLLGNALLDGVIDGKSDAS